MTSPDFFPLDGVDADLQAIAFVVKGATTHAGKLQFAAFFVMQVKVRFDATECAGNVVYDLVDQKIEVEDGSDLRDPLLQLEQVLDSSTL